VLRNNLYIEYREISRTKCKISRRGHSKADESWFLQNLSEWNYRMSRSCGGRRPKFTEIRSIPSFSVQRDVKAKREEGVQRASFFFRVFSFSAADTRTTRVDAII